MTNRKIEYWVIPPEADAEFVAHREEVWETYETPYDPACPVICLDEQPVPLLKETRTPLPATKEPGQRVDYESERAGTANMFLFTEPLAGGREVSVRKTKTKVDLGDRNGALTGGPLRPLPESDPGQRQPQHAHERGLLRRLRPGASSSIGASDGIPSHAQTRQLAAAVE